MLPDVGQAVPRKRKSPDKNFTSYKGDAIMKKRIIALVLACMLICSIAITASAESRYSGRYENCLYTATANCVVFNCGATLEGTAVNGDTDDDYQLQINMQIYRIDSLTGNEMREQVIEGPSATVAAVSKTTRYAISRMTATYYINNVQVYSMALTPN